MCAKPAMKCVAYLVAVGVAIMFGMFQAAPLVWRKTPTMRRIVLPIIVQSSKSWHGFLDEEIVQELGMPTSKAGSITMIPSDKIGNFYSVPLRLDQSFSGKDPKRFGELVGKYCQETLSIEDRVALLGNLGEIGDIQDFRNYFQELQSAHELLILEEQWIYDIGKGKFDRAIRLNFDELRKLKRVETFWKDGVK